MTRGIVYTETVVHSAPAEYAGDAPYQIAIVTLEDGNRVTARIAGHRVQIDEAVEFLETRNGFPVFRASTMK